MSLSWVKLWNYEIQVSQKKRAETEGTHLLWSSVSSDCSVWGYSDLQTRDRDQNELSWQFSWQCSWEKWEFMHVRNVTVPHILILNDTSGYRNHTDLWYSPGFGPWPLSDLELWVWPDRKHPELQPPPRRLQELLSHPFQAFLTAHLQAKTLCV